LNTFQTTPAVSATPTAGQKRGTVVAFTGSASNQYFTRTETAAQR
jgi:hypothetical protein